MKFSTYLKRQTGLTFNQLYNLDLSYDENEYLERLYYQFVEFTTDKQLLNEADVQIAMLIG